MSEELEIGSDANCSYCYALRPDHADCTFPWLPQPSYKSLDFCRASIRTASSTNEELSMGTMFERTVDIVCMSDILRTVCENNTSLWVGKSKLYRGYHDGDKVLHEESLSSSCVDGSCLICNHAVVKRRSQSPKLWLQLNARSNSDRPKSGKPKLALCQLHIAHVAMKVPNLRFGGVMGTFSIHDHGQRAGSLRHLRGLD